MYMYFYSFKMLLLLSIFRSLHVFLEISGAIKTFFLSNGAFKDYGISNNTTYTVARAGRDTINSTHRGFPKNKIWSLQSDFKSYWSLVYEWGG